MITFERLPILIFSALLTGCAGCPLPGQPTPTKIDYGLLQDLSTCDCHYLLQIPKASDIHRVDDQTSKVSARQHPLNSTRYSFLVNKDVKSLQELASESPTNDVMFHGCRDRDVKPKDGEQQFVLDAERSPWDKKPNAE